jgi:hypothetical protein
MGQNGSTKDEGGTRFATVREVRAYWDALRDDQDLPRREQINPRGMAGALHQVFMVELVAPGVARFRLAGMEISDLMGMEVRGMPLSALFDPAARADLAALIEKVAMSRMIVELDLEAERSLGRPALRARLILLPLKGTDGEADLILGCLACDGQIGRAPRRFVISRAIEIAGDDKKSKAPRLDLAKSNLSTTQPFIARSMPRLVAELAEPKPPRFEGARPPQRQNHLRLVPQDH